MQNGLKTSVNINYINIVACCIFWFTVPQHT